MMRFHGDLDVKYMLLTQGEYDFLYNINNNKWNEFFATVMLLKCKLVVIAEMHVL